MIESSYLQQNNLAKRTTRRYIGNNESAEAIESQYRSKLYPVGSRHIKIYKPSRTSNQRSDYNLQTKPESNTPTGDAGSFSTHSRVGLLLSAGSKS